MALKVFPPHPRIHKILAIGRRLELYETEIQNIIHSTQNKKPLLTLRCRPEEATRWLKQVPRHLKLYASQISPPCPDEDTMRILQNLSIKLDSTHITLKQAFLAEKMRWDSGESYLFELIAEVREFCQHLKDSVMTLEKN
jgi:hypothetical protein